MRVDNAGNHASNLPSHSQPAERETGRGPSHQASSLPLQPLRRTAGAVAGGVMSVVRHTSMALVAGVVGEALATGAEAARGRPAAPPFRGTPFRGAAPPPPEAPAPGSAPPRRMLELPPPGISGLPVSAQSAAVLPSDPMAVAGAVVATAMGVGALAAAGVAAYNKWSAGRKAAE